jgi:hypothetical protein
MGVIERNAETIGVVHNVLKRDGAGVKGVIEK